MQAISGDDLPRMSEWRLQEEERRQGRDAREAAAHRVTVSSGRHVTHPTSVLLAEERSNVDATRFVPFWHATPHIKDDTTRLARLVAARGTRLCINQGCG
jgi:hypothetical protein